MYGVLDNWQYVVDLQTVAAKSAQQLRHDGTKANRLWGLAALLRRLDEEDGGRLDKIPMYVEIRHAP